MGLNNSLALAWPSSDSAAETFGVPTEELTSSLSALVFEYQLQTGKIVNTTANYVSSPSHMRLFEDPLLIKSFEGATLVM